MRRLLIAATSIAFLLAAPNLAHAEVIKHIRVIGTHRISHETVEAYLHAKVGQPYDQKKVDESIKELFATGFFSNIKIYPQNSSLVVEVEENPTINKVAFEGNSAIKDKDLLKELAMTERGVFSHAHLQHDIKRLLALYHKRGRYTVSIEPKIVKLDQNRVDLVYEIHEGKVAKIRKINFVGNEKFTDRKLSDTIISKESRWYRFFSSSDVYDPAKLSIDQELLKRYYLSQGYADFEARSVSAELSPLRDAFVLSFVLYEGPVYTVRNINIDSKIPGLNIEKLRSLIGFASGSIYNIEAVEESIDRMTDALGDLGYAFADVDEAISKDVEKQTLDITFIINETHKIYVNKINVKNNTRTLDKVIRREFRLAEGDPYNTTKVFRSKQRISNLGYFNSVEFKNNKTDAHDRVDIDVDVEETSTGSVNFAAGYNTSIGVMGTIVFSESNFLGKGQEVGLELVRAKRAADISFSFTEPYFMDRPLAAGFDIFASSRDQMSESSFSSRTRGFSLRSAYELSEHLHHGIRYSAKKEEVSKVASDATIYIKQQEGKRITSLVGHTLTYDKLDDRISPSKGYLLRFSQDLAGLGGQTAYISHNVTGAFYYPIYKNDVIMSFITKAGNITGMRGKKVKINDRIFIGSDEIRGFDTAGIGPRTKAKMEALGGKTFYTGSLDITFPLGLNPELGLKGAVFTDFGSLFDSGERQLDAAGIYSDRYIRASYGVGVNWTSALGTIKIDYGIPFRKKFYDETKSFRISFGTRF